MNKDKAAFLSIVSNSVLILFKLTTGLLIGSISVTSEAIHSSVDLLASLIAFFSIKKASKAADYEHPFGHGKYENISGFMEAILIFIASIIIIFESLKKIIYGSNIERVGIGLLVMLLSASMNLVVSSVLRKVAKETNSIAIEVDSVHLLTDVITAAWVFLGLVLVKITGLKIIDPISAILVSLFIFKTSLTLTKKSIKDLVDSRLPDDDIEKITKIIGSHKEIKGFHKLRTRKSGEKKEIDVHLKINENFSLIQAHNLCSHIENDIKDVIPNSCILTHPEPAHSNHKSF